MEEYLILTLSSAPGTAEGDFKRQLYVFWTRMLREFPDQYERVYAERTKFETRADCVTRGYFIEAEVADFFVDQLAQAQIAHDPIDPDDLYSKFEATPPDWFQLPD